MKIFTILLTSLLIAFSLSKTGKTSSLDDTTKALPSIFDLQDNPDGVTTIKAPSGLQWFKAAAVGDLNNDGYDDIIIIGAKNYVSSDEYTPVIYIIYGGPHLPAVINLEDPQVKVATITWVSENIKMSIQSLTIGDINADGRKEIVFAGSYVAINGTFNVYDYGLYMIPQDYYSQGENTISENTPGMIKVYASVGTDPGKRSEQGYMAQNKGDYFVKDMNNDGKDDIIISYPWKHIVGYSPMLGEIYIVYGNNTMPSDINAENTNLYVTKIVGDTNYYPPGNNYSFKSLSISDIDGDNKPDLVFPAGDNQLQCIINKDYSSYHSISYVLYGSLLSALLSRGTAFNLQERIMGLTSYTLYTDYLKYGIFESDHTTSAGDINGDGYDDIFISYLNREGMSAAGHSIIYILFGQRDFLFSGNLDQITHGIIKMKSTAVGDFLGSTIAFGDITGDGYNECLLGTGTSAINGTSFCILYGQTTFPDSFDVSASSPYVSVVSGGKFMDVGDFNNDGYQDIVGNKLDGNVFVIYGRGKNYNVKNSIVKPLPGSSKAKYTFAFSDSSKFHFKFTYGGPSNNSELHLKNFGNHLPDSLQSIPTSKKVVSFINADLINMPSIFTYRARCSIDYTDSALIFSGIKKQDLVVSYWNEQKSKWEKIQTIIDTTSNRATFEVDHLSLFALTDKHDSILTGINDSYMSSIPLTFELSQNYPNPFNPVTTIKYQLPKSSQVTLRIYNILGQEVKTVISEQMSAGIHEVQWDGTNNFGSKVSSGIYIYRMETNTGYVRTRKMVFLK